MGRVLVAAETGVHTDAAPLIVGEAVEHAVVEIDEALQEPSRPVEQQRQTGLGEVDLDVAGPGVETAADVGLGFVDEIGEERVARYPAIPSSVRTGSRRVWP